MRVVMNLTKPYTNKGYRLFFDNKYTRVPFFPELERTVILACGTVRSNKKFLPKDIFDHGNQQRKRHKRGDSLFCQSGNLLHMEGQKAC